MKNKETATFCIEALKKAGADKSQCVLSKSKKYELNAEAGEISLLRTTFNTNIRLMAIKDKRRGYVSLNGEDKSAIEEAAKNAVKFSEASPQDEAYDISEIQPTETFDNGMVEPDLDRIYNRLNNFIMEAKKRYPKVNMRTSTIDFTRTDSYLLNSNGIDFLSSQGIYEVVAMFSSQDGKKTSSFNYSVFSSKDLEKEIIDSSSFDTLLKQSSQQTEAKALEGKFTGDIIVTPDCLGDFMGFISDAAIRDGSLIAGTSIYKDKLNKTIASDKFTLHSAPVSPEIADGYFITPDGYKAENLTIIDKGVLKTFILSLYGAKKTGLDRVSNSGSCYMVDPGEKSFADIVKSIKKGLLVARFSGGRPNDNGDFSGIAKNSYYIEDGKIQYPVSETMIAGNIPQMFLSIKDISKERVDYGSGILPWISFGGITVSGK
jgi:PmbA protein